MLGQLTGPTDFAGQGKWARTDKRACAGSGLQQLFPRMKPFAELEARVRAAESQRRKERPAEREALSMADVLAGLGFKPLAGRATASSKSARKRQSGPCDEVRRGE